MKVAEHLPGPPKVQDSKKPSFACASCSSSHLYKNTLFSFVKALHLTAHPHRVLHVPVDSYLMASELNLDSSLYTTCFQSSLV